MNSSERKPGQQGEQGDKQQPQQQQQGGAQGQYGEGNYKATRDYNAGVKDHMQHHDVEKEARDAAPKSEQEKREMEQAEQLGKSKSKAGPEQDMKGGKDGKA
jgi:hypothetical protein